MKNNTVTDRIRLLQKGLALLLVLIFIVGILPAAAFNVAAEDSDASVMGIVKVDNLEVRSEPSATADILEHLAINTRVEILEQKIIDGVTWGRIEEGWIDLKDVTIESKTASDNEQTEPEQTDPPEPEQTDPPEPEQTDPPEPEQTDPPEPEQTDPPEPEQTDPPEPEQTDPPEPEQTDPPEPEQTDPPEPEQTDPPEPEQTDPPEPEQTDPPADDPDDELPEEEEEEEEKKRPGMSYLGLPDYSTPVRSSKKSSSYLRGPTRSGSSDGPTLTKTAVLREDGDYDLKLTLQGDPDVSTSVPMIDFLIIVDRSNSMVVTEDITATTGRLANLITEVNVGDEDKGQPGLIDALASNPNINAAFRIMEFSGSGHPKAVDDAVADYHTAYKVVDYSPWYTAASEAKAYVSQIRAFSQAIYNGGYTNKYYSYSNDSIVTGNAIIADGLARDNFSTEGYSHPKGSEFYYSLRATNYEAVFRTINGENPDHEMIMDNRDDAEKVIIFLTDGNPTVAWTNLDDKGYTEWCGTHQRYEFKETDNAHRWNSEGHGTTYAGTENVYACLTEALDDMAQVEVDRFYAVGFGEASVENLQTLAGALPEGTRTGVFYSGDGKLLSKFNEISEEFSVKHYSNVTITDTLRHGENNVLKVDVTDDATIQVEVKKGDAVIGTYSDDRKSVVLPVTLQNGGFEASRTLTVSRVGDQLILDFPDEYRLESGYTYTLSAVIRPTEQAYREWREAGYTEMPDGNTGTHADNGENGLFSNDRAVVTYKYGETEGEQLPEAVYDHPVVRLDPGKLVITKKITGLTSAQIQNLGLTFTVKLTYPDNGDELGNEEETVTVRLSDMSVDENDNYTYTIDKLSPGTEYTVTEAFTTPTGYRVTSTVNGEVSTTADGEIPKGGTATAAFENAFEVAVTTVKVEKQVTGNMGDWDKEFAFTVTLMGRVSSMEGLTYVKYAKNANGTLTAGNEVEIGSETFSFKLKDNEYCIFYNVPVGSNMRVEEIPEDYTLVKGEVDAKNFPIKENGVEFRLKAPAAGSDYGHVVIFHNDRTVVIETGIILDSLPYVLILIGVVAAGAFLFLRKSRRYEED